jgi:hypothetical protein
MYVYKVSRWEEEFLALFKVLPQHLFRVTEINQEHYFQDIQFSGLGCTWDLLNTKQDR